MGVKTWLHDKIKYYESKALHILIFPFIILMLGFFILFSWYDCLQQWCEYWFMTPGQTRNEIGRKAMGDTVFAIFTTVLLLLIILVFKP